ncbi:MAG: class I SAM-dependent RNA methyltransferase, partial [Bryobacterales bacterium]|nr:class I SAM-dependent RNA methyltransferase [Bryobacterales bacterium]
MSGKETSIVNEARSQEAGAKIDKWVYGGEGLARIDGRVALVPFVLPGEEVRIRMADQVHAKLVSITERAPERVEPPCPLFERCGGCQYQHAPYEFQVARKADILREQLRRVGKIDFAGDIHVVSGPQLGYRNRVQLRIEGARIGYLAAGSHDLVPVEGECPISSPGVNQALAEMRERLKSPKFPRFVHSLEIFTNENDVQINILESERHVARAFFDWCGSVAELDYATAFGNFRVGPRPFFQVNRFLIE